MKFLYLLGKYMLATHERFKHTYIITEILKII